MTFPENSRNTRVNPFHTITRRELLSCLFFAVLVLFAWFLLMMVIWIVTPTEPEVRLDLSDYPPSDVPYRIVRQEGTFWLVHHEDEVLALHPETPDTRMQCEYVWESPNERFVDPCLGSKLTLLGEYIEGPGVRDLDRFTLRVQDDRVIVRVGHIIRGEAISAPV